MDKDDMELLLNNYKKLVDILITENDDLRRRLNARYTEQPK